MKKFIAILLGLLIVSSVFANLNFYAHVRTGLWYDIYDKDFNSYYYDIEESKTELDLSLYSCSRFGATFTDENYILKTEFGISSTNVSLRHLYGEYKFEKFSILIGQTWTGLSELAKRVADNGNSLIGMGMFYDGRVPQLTFKMNNAYISLMQPHKADPQGLGSGAIDALMPKVNVGYKYNKDGICIHPSFGINSSNYNKDFTGIDEGVTAIIFSLTAKYIQENYELAGQYNYGQNAGDYGISNGWSAGFDGEDIVDAITNAGYGQITYKMTDKANFTAGYGVMTQKYDVKDAEEVSNSTFFIQSKITLAKNVWVVPEIGMINYGEVNDVKVGTRTYLGAMFEMRFSH